MKLTSKVETNKEKLNNKVFIDSFMLKEHKDQKRRVFVRELPIMLIFTTVLCGVGWWLGQYVFWLSYALYTLAVFIFLYVIIKKMIPHYKGPLSIYYGENKKFQRRIGIVLPLKTDQIKKVSKKWGWTEYELENVQSKKFHFVFILSFTENTSTEIIEKETQQIREFLEDNPATIYSELRKKFNQEHYKGKLLYVLSEHTGFIPDEYEYYRSYGIPRIDNISIYHREHLTPYTVISGYIKEGEAQFYPFYKRMWQDDIPEWASFFTNSEYQTFEKEVYSYFTNLNIDFSIDDGTVKVEENEFGFQNLGLTNVAQVCKQENPNLYKEIIKEHFDSVVSTLKFEQDFEKIANNFEDVKQYIAVRLYNHEYVSYIGKENVLGKDFEGDIYAMLVFDFPNSISNIKPEQIEVWNKSVDELFEIGKNNIRKKYPLTITKEKMGKYSILFANANHFFTPNIVFDIENRSEIIGTYGSIIGLPHRHSVLIYPIENLDVVKAVSDIAQAVQSMNHEGPGSLSDNIFWYFNNTFTLLPFNLDNDTVQFVPPDNFLEMLNNLKPNENAS